MQSDADKNTNQKKEEEEKKLAEYQEYQVYYKTQSESNFKFLYKAVVWIVVPLLILILADRLTCLTLLSAAQYFFIFISIASFGISLLLHWNYKRIINDPLSDYSKEIPLLASNRSYDKRLANNRKTVYNNMVPFWIGIASLLVVILIWLIAPVKFNDGCKEKSASGKRTTGSITIDLLQINDVYEISPLNNDSIGGMARIATIKKQFLEKNKNTMLLIAGDFISPSVYNSVELNGKKVAGKQMVAAMNVAGVDLAIFGNHEFDFGYSVLQQRMNESWFDWTASNVFHKKDSVSVRFQKNNEDIPETYKKTFINADGTPFTIGFFGLTIPDNYGDSGYAFYNNPLTVAKAMYKRLAADCDAVIAITHQDIKDDSILAMQIPQLTAIIGGHEHDMQFTKVGNVYITKAHSNAKSVFHLKLTINKNGNPKVTVEPELIPVDISVQQDYLTKAISEKWTDVAMQYFKNTGFNPGEEVCKDFKSRLDGRDAEVRNGKTNLTKLITDAMLAAGKTKGCELAMLNAGSIRVDDVIAPPITQYSFLRALPYGGKIYVARIKGSFIKTLIDSAAHLVNEGAYLQYSFAGKDSVNTLKDYNVAIGSFLINGRQSKLNFLNAGNPNVISVDTTAAAHEPDFADIRKAVIDYLKKNCGNKSVMSKYQ